jgi:hypothetical protein
MTRRETVLLMACVLSVYGVGNVWLVQLSSYKLWPFVGPHEFHVYHLAWWRSIWGVVLLPAVLVFLLSILMLWWPPPRVPSWMIWAGLALQLLLVLGTALYWGPLMARVSAPETGLSPVLYRQLMLTHWLRVAIVTAYGALTVWMLASSAWLSCPG